MIRLLKDRIVYTNQYNPEYEKYVKKEVPFLSPYLNETVELSEDFTLEDLFKILEREKDVFDVVFSSHLGHYPLQLYIDDIKKPRTEKDDDIQYLELRRYGERWDWGEIALFIDFSGMGKEHEAGNSYALEFTPLNELKHFPLRLNEKFEISEVKLPPKTLQDVIIRLLEKIHIPNPLGWERRGYFSHVYVEGKVKFSVYELISTVLYEISFVGGPVERDAKLMEIGKDIEEIKEELDKEKK